jgi:DNA-binding IclR family transcriptional regulator
MTSRRQDLSKPERRAPPAFASTLANGLALLGCFGATTPVLANREIAERLSLPRPTVTRLAGTLMQLGYLQRDPRSGRYRLAPAVLSLGYPFLAQLSVRQVAATESLALVKLARGPISLGTRDRLQVIYLETVRSAGSNATRPDVGSTRPFLRTAIGRALYAAHPAHEREPLARALREAWPEDWARHGEALEGAVAQIASHGFCVVEGDWRPNLAAVAVPLRRPVDGLPMALNLTVQRFDVSRETLVGEFGPRLAGVARSIEDRLGLEADATPC